MTKKDFEMIASVFNSLHPIDSGRAQDVAYRQTWEVLADAFATALASQNPRFDRARFLAACGME